MHLDIEKGEKAKQQLKIIQDMIGEGDIDRLHNRNKYIYDRMQNFAKTETPDEIFDLIENLISEIENDLGVELVDVGFLWAFTVRILFFLASVTLETVKANIISTSINHFVTTATKPGGVSGMTTASVQGS